MSVNELCHYLLFLGLFVAFAYDRKQPPAFGASLYFLCTLLSFLGLSFCHTSSNFSNYNVFTNSNANAPLLYQISGTWSNHEGSILLWCWILSFYGFLFRYRVQPHNVSERGRETAFCSFVLSSVKPEQRESSGAEEYFEQARTSAPYRSNCHPHPICRYGRYGDGSRAAFLHPYRSIGAPLSRYLLGGGRALYPYPYPYPYLNRGRGGPTAPSPLSRWDMGPRYSFLASPLQISSSSFFGPLPSPLSIGMGFDSSPLNPLHLTSLYMAAPPLYRLTIDSCPPLPPLYRLINDRQLPPLLYRLRYTVAPPLYRLTIDSGPLYKLNSMGYGYSRHSTPSLISLWGGGERASSRRSTPSLISLWGGGEMGRNRTLNGEIGRNRTLNMLDPERQGPFLLDRGGSGGSRALSARSGKKATLLLHLAQDAEERAEQRISGAVGIALFFPLFLLASSNPFVRNSFVCTESLAELNPVLQDPVLAIHPPCIYAGDVASAMGFGLCIYKMINGIVALYSPMQKEGNGALCSAGCVGAPTSAHPTQYRSTGGRSRSTVTVTVTICGGPENRSRGGPENRDRGGGQSQSQSQSTIYCGGPENRSRGGPENRSRGGGGVVECSARPRPTPYLPRYSWGGRLGALYRYMAPPHRYIGLYGGPPIYSRGTRPPQIDIDRAPPSLYMGREGGRGKLSIVGTLYRDMAGEPLGDSIDIACARPTPIGQLSRVGGGPISLWGTRPPLSIWGRGTLDRCRTAGVNTVVSDPRKDRERIRIWILTCWWFFTVGILLGSWWAYHELGWGGWWFWDPVENASLMPWVLATACIHSVILPKVYFWTLFLNIVTFLCCVLGTFLVRSGLLASVHSFATDSTRGIFLWRFFLLITGISLILFFQIRGHRSIERALFSEPLTVRRSFMRS